jgi:hypothetical protein
MPARKKPHTRPSPVKKTSPVQGEGNYDASRRHRASVDAFLNTTNVEEAARDAEPQTPVEEQALFDAERIGESHSKGEDPASK